MKDQWWMEVGSETCSICERRHHYEVTVHCVDCDRPVCPFCAVEVRERPGVSCRRCEPEEEGA